YNNISVRGELKVGIRAPGFQSGKDWTFLRVRGSLLVIGNVSLGRGSRIEIGEGAICKLTSCNLNGASDIIISHGLEIGEGSVIAWGCQIMDNDWHNVNYPGKRNRDPKIVLGRRVWVGSRVLIHKGTQIGDGCVIAAGSVVSGIFPPGVLIGGNPARIIREDVNWD
ncbi:MAG TPA: acyltransferase, partial [Nitrospira sp.]|nr:acyltransferase [Nitrospira sp.]